MNFLQRSSALLTALLLTSATLPAVTAAPAQAAPVPAAVNTQAAPTMAPTAVPRTGRVNVTLVTVQTADRTAAQTKAINLTTAKASISTASDYWRTMSNGRLSLYVGKTVTGFKTKARSDWSFERILTTVTSEMKWQQNANTALVVFMPRTDVIVYGTSGNYGAGWSGGATSGRVLMPYTNSLTNTVMTHEFGHVFGLNHANALQCNNGAMDTRWNGSSLSDRSCYAREYGDTTDVMGATQYARPYLNSVLFDYGAFGRGDEILRTKTAVGTKTYTLTAWAGTAARRAVKFSDPWTGETYYLQLRLPVGYDAGKAVGGNRGVEILKTSQADPASSLLIPPSTRPFAGWYNNNHAWQSGQTFTTAGGTKVSVNWIGTSSASVTVKAGPSVAALVTPFKNLGVKGNLGTATSKIYIGLKNNGAYQLFQRGEVLYSPKTGSHYTRGAIRTKWAQKGSEVGILGYPTSDEITGLKNGGTAQHFEGGSVYDSASTAPFVSRGAIRSMWGTVGAYNGILGYPTSDEITGLKNGGSYQQFQGGTIYWSPATGARISKGAIRAAWGKAGFEKGVLGYPTTNEVGGLVRGGMYQKYQGGTFHWTAKTGAWYTKGAIQTAWAKIGYEKSKLGYPTSNEYVISGGTRQLFEGGYITWSAKKGAVVTYK